LNFITQIEGGSNPDAAGRATNLTSVPLAADFTGSPSSGPVPLIVTFSDTSTGSITNRFWDFGDTGTTNVTTNTVSHTYAAGTYPVTLIVSGPGGSDTNTKPNYITALTTFQSWQIQYFTSTNNPAAAASADPDGDSCNNLCEFSAGTNPTNSASSFRITSVAAQGSNVLVSWSTAGGRTNALQATDGLLGGSYSTNFLDISPFVIIPGSGDTTTNWPDAGGATNVPSRYYRIRLVP
jgi:PKD repeat protein